MTSQQLSSRPKAPILIFDIETVPDVPLIESSYTYAGEGSFNETKDWKDYKLAERIATENQVRFFSPIYHSIVSVCALFIHPESNQITDGFKRTIACPENYVDFKRAERNLLDEFWRFSMKYKDHHTLWYDQLQSDMRMSDYQRKKLKPVPVTFCGYNIAEFDLPVLEQRSLRYLLTCPVTDYAKDSGTDSYRYKFALDKSYDLCQFIANHQPGCKARLDVVSRAMGLGGKMEGMDGSKVAEEYFENGAWNKIEEYCAVDVLITYGVYLAVEKFRALLSEDEFKEALLAFERFLLQEGKPATYRELALHSETFFAYAKQEKSI